MSDSPLQRWILILLAPALLTGTALVQRYQAEAYGLNPWKGGGFGMFADLHRTEYRQLRITLVDVRTEGSQPIGYRIRPPKRLRRAATAVRTLPTRNRMTAFARVIAGEEWFLVRSRKTGKIVPVLMQEVIGYEQPRPLTLRGVRVEIEQYDFDRTTNQLVRSPLLEVTVTLQPGAAQ